MPSAPTPWLQQGSATRPSAPALAHPTRRSALAALAGGAWLAGCGGGFGDEPQILRFDAGTTQAFVGESVRLHVNFSGGSGRIEPDIGRVASGAEVTTPVLDRDRSFRLVVEGAGGRVATRTLDIRVGWRDRYATPPGLAPMTQHAAAAAADGSVLLFGGSRGTGVFSGAIERFDPATGLVTRIGQLPQGRAMATATRLPSGRVLLAGGMGTGSDWRPADLVDERSGAVTPAGALSVARQDHAAVLLANGAVLVTGGVAAGEGELYGISRSAELWEPATQRFRRLARTMSIQRAAHSATLLPDGRVLIAGGYTAGAAWVFAELFDPATETFTPLPGAWPQRAHHVALAAPDGRVLLLGGEAQPPGAVDPLPRADVLRYDPSTARLDALPSLRAPRTFARGAMLPSGQALLFGGQQGAGPVAGAELYDPATGGRALAALDTPRQLHTVTRLASGRVAVIGGERQDGSPIATIQVYE